MPVITPSLHYSKLYQPKEGFIKQNKKDNNVNESYIYQIYPVSLATLFPAVLKQEI